MKIAKVISKRFLSPNFVELWLEENDIARLARPGQFVMISTGKTYDPFLKRPFGVLSTRENQFGLLFEIVGRGTQILSQIEPGNQIDVIGPLGNGFSLNPGEAFIIGGGRGLVPLYFLAQFFSLKKVPFQFFFGIKNVEEKVLIDYLKQLSLPIVLTCEEKISDLYCGTVVDAFIEWFHHANPKPKWKMYACGPQGMFEALAKINGIEQSRIEISMESRMGCGYGVCLSCAVKKRGSPGYYHVCQDGPVFLLGEVEI